MNQNRFISWQAVFGSASDCSSTCLHCAIPTKLYCDAHAIDDSLRTMTIDHNSRKIVIDWYIPMRFVVSLARAKSWRALKLDLSIHVLPTA